jgi:hypothetical protein
LKVTFLGKDVEATVVDFLTRKEDFNEYQLTDGQVLKMKLVVTRIMKLEGQKNPDGSQAYVISSANVVAPME